MSSYCQTIRQATINIHKVTALLIYRHLDGQVSYIPYHYTTFNLLPAVPDYIRFFFHFLLEHEVPTLNVLKIKRGINQQDMK